MLVLVGSTRPAKVEGTREALVAIARVASRFAGFTLQPHDLTHIAPRMPMSVAETIDGARIRAAALLNITAAGSQVHRPTFAVGLEGGLVQLPGGDWSLQSWAVVTDGDRWGYGAGPVLVLPAHVAERVVGGEELGDVIDELASSSVRGTHGAWGILTLDLIGRRDAFRLAVIAAMAPFYNGAAWSSTGDHDLRLDS